MTYTYDAWGAVSYSVSSMQNMQLAASLYNVNPFTYRGESDMRVWIRY